MPFPFNYLRGRLVGEIITLTKVFFESGMGGLIIWEVILKCFDSLLKCCRIPTKMLYWLIIRWLIMQFVHVLRKKTREYEWLS